MARKISKKTQRRRKGATHERKKASQTAFQAENRLRLVDKRAKKDKQQAFEKV